MADYLREELSKLLDQYDEKRRATAAREQKVRDDDARFIEKFAELRRGVVRPAFEAAAAILAEHGHQASIAEQEFTVDASSKVTEALITLRIVPAGASSGGAPARALSIGTRHYSKTVSIEAGRPLEGAKNTYPVEQVDRQLVEQELIRFVAGIVAA